MESIEHGKATGADVYKPGPNTKTLKFLSTTSCRTIAEIGVEWGLTSEGILRWLDGRGTLHLFDFEDRLAKTSRTLGEKGFSNFVTHGNSRCTLDSYNWSLMELLRDNPEPIFDYVFLDGAHTWAFDALAFFLIDLLLRPGGYLDFDDYYWTIASSPTVNPEVNPVMNSLYTEAQISTPQVKIIVDLLVRRRDDYEEVVPNKIFRKRRKLWGLDAFRRLARR
jgi:predicted O-methyltransferase YrrM